MKVTIDTDAISDAIAENGRRIQSYRREVDELQGSIDRLEAANQNLREFSTSLQSAQSAQYRVSAPTVTPLVMPDLLTALETHTYYTQSGIACIKTIRERRGLGLREAKDVFDRARGTTVGGLL